MKPIGQLIVMLSLAYALGSCSNDTTDSIPPLALFKNGDFTTEGQRIPIGGKLSFGIAASAGSAPITNLRIQRIANGKVITELDKGVFITTGGLDYVFNAVKSGAQEEQWRFMVMNANRDSSIITRTVLLGDGSAYGPITHYTLTLGMQNNTLHPNFLDLHSGNAFSPLSISGNEASVDLVAFVYETGGKLSPTLCCPAYTGSSSVTTHYPEIGTWSTRNSTLYDYYSADWSLVKPDEFERAESDSLLVASYNPQNVSGLCKYCYTNKIIPFKTENGKYGLVKVKYADTSKDGIIELEVKIQQ